MIHQFGSYHYRQLMSAQTSMHMCTVIPEHSQLAYAKCEAKGSDKDNIYIKSRWIAKIEQRPPSICPVLSQYPLGGSWIPSKLQKGVLARTTSHLQMGKRGSVGRALY